MCCNNLKLMTNTDNRYEEYIELLKANKNLILTGAPGTGKTYLAKKIAEILVGMQTKSYKNEPVNFNEIIEKYIVPNDYLSSSGRVTYHVDKVENNKVFTQLYTLLYQRFCIITILSQKLSPQKNKGDISLKRCHPC